LTRILFALVATCLMAGPVPASPKPCRDAQGRIIKCPPPAKAAQARCKDDKGRFVACDKPGARPAPKS
jgi:hypothetical protein